VGHAVRARSKDGEHVVPAGGDDEFGGVVLCVHCIHRHHDVLQVEQSEKVTGGGDFVALGCGGDLAEHGAGGVVERGDQVRRRRGWGAGTAHGLAVQGDDPATTDHLGACPAERADDRVEDVGVHPGEHPPDRGLTRPRRTQLGEQLGGSLADPLPDRGERAGPGQHRRQPHSQQPRQRVPHPAWVPRVGNPPQQGDQARTEVQGCVGRDGARRCETMTSAGVVLSMRSRVRTTTQAPRATPAPRDTPVTPQQRRRSQAYGPTLPRPWASGSSRGVRSRTARTGWVGATL